MKPLESVSVQENEIRLGESATIELKAASHWHPNPSPALSSIHQVLVPDETLLLASGILMIVDNKLSALDPSGIAHQGLIEFLRGGVLPLRKSSETKQFRESAMRIVGLGGGFTPSGDDVLGGFLAAFNALARKIGRSEILFDFTLLEGRTSWISAKLVDYMQRLVLDEQVNHLIASAVSEDGEGFVISAESILPRGHTSGIDILVGIILALSLVRGIETQSGVIERVASRLGLYRRDEARQLS